MGISPLEQQLENGLADRRFGTRLGEAADQVPRRLAYEAAHPGAVIREPCIHDGMWTAILDEGTVEVRAVNLVLLMDRLLDLDSRDADPGDQF